MLTAATKKVYVCVCMCVCVCVCGWVGMMKFVNVRICFYIFSTCVYRQEIIYCE